MSPTTTSSRRSPSALTASPPISPAVHTTPEKPTDGDPAWLHRSTPHVEISPSPATRKVREGRPTTMGCMTSTHDTTRRRSRAFEASGWERQATGYDAFSQRVAGRTDRPPCSTLPAWVAGTRLPGISHRTGTRGRPSPAASRCERQTGIDIAEVDARHRPAPVARRRVPPGRRPPTSLRRWLVRHDHRELSDVAPRPARTHAVGEFVRVLKPGGRVALTVWDEAARMPLLGAVAAALEACGARPPDDIPVGPPFFRFSNDDEFRALLETGGFDQVTVETLRFTHRISDPTRHGRASSRGRCGRRRSSCANRRRRSTRFESRSPKSSSPTAAAPPSTCRYR